MIYSLLRETPLRCLSLGRIFTPSQGGVFVLQQRTSTYGSEDLRMFNDTSIPLFLIGELVADLRANDRDTF